MLAPLRSHTSDGDQHLQGVEATDQDQTERTVRIICAIESNSKTHTKRSRGTKSKNKNPRPPATLGVGYFSNTRSETQTFEHLVEDNGDDKDQVSLDCKRDSDTDKNGVEQDTALEKADVEGHLAQDFGIDLLVLEIKVKVLSRSA